MDWNYNISQAPKGKTETKTKLIKGEVRSWEEHVPERLLLTHKDGKVYATYWIAGEYTKDGVLRSGERWSGWNRDEVPVAWMPFPEPANPNGGN